MLVRDSGRAHHISLRESRVLHQPRSRNFVLGIESGIAGNLKAFGGRARSELFEVSLAEDWVLEERSGATAIVVSGDKQHAFAAPNFAHRLARFAERRHLFLAEPSGKILLQVGILQARSAASVQSIVHP